MASSTSLRIELASKDNLAWFDTLCDILRKRKAPSVHQLERLIGIEKSNPNNEIRGSKFLVPFDKRFTWACINPALTSSQGDRPIDYFAIGGKNFQLKMSDIIDRFPLYRTNRNIYDGGTQILFYPIADEFEFSGISFDRPEEPEDIAAIKSLVFHNVTFWFGNKLIQGQDGYSLRR